MVYMTGFIIIPYYEGNFKDSGKKVVHVLLKTEVFVVKCRKT